MTTSRIRIAFLGTPTVSVPSLMAMTEIGDVVVVVTQPDRPRGRSRTPQPPAVKVRAYELGIPIRQPERSTDIAEVLADAGPIDVGVLVAYGQLIRPEALTVPRRGIINGHLSLLPRWRGAAPVQRALLAGDRRTGSTIMVLDPGLDTGPVLSTWSTAVGIDEDAGTLTARLGEGTARLLADTVPEWVRGDVVAVPQPDDGASYAAKIEPADRTIDWAEPAESVHHRIRALAPRPGATAHIDGRVFKILSAQVLGDQGDPGVARADAGSVVVGCGEGSLLLVDVQPAGKPVMPAADWARGVRTWPLVFDPQEP